MNIPPFKKYIFFFKFFSNKNVTKRYSEGETPAHEVIELMGQGQGFFGYSSTVRIRKPSVKFHVGQLFKHKNLKYYGVITGWDYVCKAPNPWKMSMLGK